eukprot:scaffold6917_cov167-Chaetoceros_neogracile.AAC.1
MILDSKHAYSSQEITAAQTLTAIVIRSPANSTTCPIMPVVAQAQTAPVAPPAMVPGALLALPTASVLVRNGMPPIPTALLQQQPKAAKTSDSTFEKNFPQKLLDILETPEHSDILKWLPGGEAFIIVDKTRFASEDLPALLKETQFTSFIRKLCRWKFIRIPRRGPFTGHHVYYHELFRRDQPALCKLMSCNGNITSSLNAGIAQAKRQRSLDSMSTSILSSVVGRPKQTVRELYDLNQQNSLQMTMLEEASNRAFLIKERLLNIRFERDRLYDERQKRIVRQTEVSHYERQQVQGSSRQSEFSFYEQQQQRILRHEEARPLYEHQTGTPGYAVFSTSAREPDPLVPATSRQQHLPNQFPCGPRQAHIIHPHLAMTNVDGRTSSNNKSKIFQGAYTALRCGNTMEYNALMSQLTKLRKAEMLDRAAAVTRNQYVQQQQEGNLSRAEVILRAAAARDFKTGRN